MIKYILNATADRLWRLEIEEVSLSEFKVSLTEGGGGNGELRDFP
jgi:hypothetical protein